MKRRGPKKRPGDPGYDPYDFDSDEEQSEDDGEDGGKEEGEEEMETEQDSSSGTGGEQKGGTTVQLSSERYSLFSSRTVFHQLSVECQSSIFSYRLDHFRSLVHDVFSEEHSQSLPVAHILQYINKDPATQPYSREELLAALDVMQEANQVMVSEEMVFLI